MKDTEYVALQRIASKMEAIHKYDQRAVFMRVQEWSLMISLQPCIIINARLGISKFSKTEFDTFEMQNKKDRCTIHIIDILIITQTVHKT